MAVESSIASVGDLNPLWPTGSESKAEGDNHLRNIKEALRISFAGFTGAVMVTGTDGGGLNAYTVTPTTALTAYGTRMGVVFSPVITNTDACTINISGLGVMALNSVSGDALVAGDLVVGQIYITVYTGSEFRLLSPTKNYIDQLAFLSALPAQAGNAGKFTTTDGTSARWDHVTGNNLYLNANCGGF